MGGGGYSSVDRHTRAVKSGYYSKPIEHTFSQRETHKDMNPHGVLLRESRDSDEHPLSVPIILALDHTGSMGSVPAHLVRDGLPTVVDNIIKAGVKDPQVLFLGVGDHECDSSPLQVGQFESSDELMDKWLTSIYLEGGGGGNAGESYHLAWFFAGRYTEHDAMDKRGKKGYLFTIGDEPVLGNLPANVQKALMGEGQFSEESAASLLEKAREKYHVYHIHVNETWTGQRHGTSDGWKQLLGDNVIVCQSHKDIPDIVSSIVSKGEKEEGSIHTTTVPQSTTKPSSTTKEENTDSTIPTML